MTTKTMTKMEWMAWETRLERACRAGEEIVDGKFAPIDPLAITRSEGRKRLRCHGEDFGAAFDGHLRYHRSHGCFVLLYNTMYDRGLIDGHHPRTRFSIAHELGHYFLDKHRAHLLQGGATHESRSEFRTDEIVEREADSFAAGLLIPCKLARRVVNQGELSLAVIDEVCAMFNVSRVSAALRAVQLSDFWCAAVGIRDGQIRWCFRSQPLIEAGLYPPEKKPPESESARRNWRAFESGSMVASSGAAFTKVWFRMFGQTELELLHVDEQYMPVRSMGTLVVLLSVPEDAYLTVGDA